MSSVRMMQHFAAPGRLGALIQGEIGEDNDGLLKVSVDWFGQRLLVESVQEELAKRDKVVRTQAMHRMCFLRRMKEARVARLQATRLVYT